MTTRAQRAPGGNSGQNPGRGPDRARAKKWLEKHGHGAPTLAALDVARDGAGVCAALRWAHGVSDAQYAAAGGRI